MKEITFTLVEQSLSHVAEMPSPSINNLPEWYKKTDSFIGGKVEAEGGNLNLTLKKCIPVLDAISQGYIIKLWTDVYVERKNNSVSYHFSVQRGDVPRAVEGHALEQAPLYPIKDCYDKSILKWINPWHIKTPKGYSVLFTTPNHRDLPFEIMEGVVDTDTFPLTVNFPFFIKKDFEGIIPHGTPIAQVIPFKRESWKTKIGEHDENEYLSLNNFHDSYFMNRYKKKWWNRKSFK